MAQSWQYVAPSMRKGYTLKTWEKGDIPVVPYPVYKFDKLTQYHLVYAHKNDMLVELSLSPQPKTNERVIVFRIGLERAGHRWLVNYWMPRYSPPVLANGENG
jgi:hypothetical protein